MRQLALASIAVLGAAGSAMAGGVQVSVNFGTPYYGYAPADVVYVQRYIPAYDVPRVFYVARHARVAPSVIVGCYRGGWGWDRIYGRYRVPRGGYGGYYAPSPARAYYSAPVYYNGGGPGYRSDRGYSRGHGYRGNRDHGRYRRWRD